MIAQRVERPHVLVELALGGGDGLLQLRAARDVALQIVRACGEPVLEVGGGFLQPAHLRREGAGTLDERRVRRLGFGRPPRLRFHRFARFEEPALRRGELFVGDPLVGLDARDRFTRFVVPRFLRPQFLLRAAAFEIDLILLAADPLRRFQRVGRLQLESDRRLLLPVLLRLQRDDRGFGRGNRHVEGLNLVPHLHERRLFGRGALAQLLDLALGRQQPARLRAGPAFQPVRAAEHLAVERRDGRRCLARGLARRVRGLRNPRFPNRRKNREGNN